LPLILKQDLAFFRTKPCHSLCEIFPLTRECTTKTITAMAQYPTTRDATSGYGFQQPVELQRQMFPNQGYFYQGRFLKNTLQITAQATLYSLRF